MAMRKREDEVFPNATGIDIGASSHWVAVPRHLAQAAGEEPVREIGAMTDDLNGLTRRSISGALAGASSKLISPAETLAATAAGSCIQHRAWRIIRARTRRPRKVRPA